LGKADRHSLDLVFNRHCVKLFKTWSIDIVKDCRNCFAIDLPSCVVKRRQNKFILRYFFQSEWFRPILQQVVIHN